MASRDFSSFYPATLIFGNEKSLEQSRTLCKRRGDSTALPNNFGAASRAKLEDMHLLQFAIYKNLNRAHARILYIYVYIRQIMRTNIF